MQTTQEGKEKNEGRSYIVREEGKEGKVPQFHTAYDGWLVSDASGSGAASSSQAPIAVAESTEKRILKDKWDEDEMPEKSQKISNVCIGYGTSDNIGEAPCQEEDEEDLMKMRKNARPGTEQENALSTKERSTPPTET